MVIQPQQPMVPPGFHPHHTMPIAQFQKAVTAPGNNPSVPGNVGIQTASTPTPPPATGGTPPSHTVHSNMALYLNQFGKNSAPPPQAKQGQPSMSQFMQH
jgi:hypothetical protein